MYKKELILLLAAAILLLVIIYAIDVGITPINNQIRNEQVNAITIEYSNGTNARENVYIANTPIEQATGLMYMNSMENCNGIGNCYGMLFVFPNSSDECFWMKNTEMPLKQFWIYNNTIIYEIRGIPYSLKSFCHYGNYVLEASINSSLGIGDHIYFNYLNGSGYKRN